MFPFPFTFMQPKGPAEIEAPTNIASTKTGSKFVLQTCLLSTGNQIGVLFSDGFDLIWVYSTTEDSVADWSTPLTLGAFKDSSNNNLMTCPVVVFSDGLPRYAFRNNSDDITYLKADDATGTSWSSYTVAAGLLSYNRGVSLAETHGSNKGVLVIIGNQNAVGAQLYYIEDKNLGMSWTLLTTINDLGQVCSAPLLLTLSNNTILSVVSYNTQANVYFRVADNDGDQATDWTSPTSNEFVTFGEAMLTAAASAAIINGNPAVAMIDTLSTNLYFVRATNADGSTWGDDVKVTTSIISSGYDVAKDAASIKLGVNHNGFPFVTCNTTSGSTIFTNDNISGSGTWTANTYDTSNTSNPATAASAVVLNGKTRLFYTTGTGVFVDDDVG